MNTLNYWLGKLQRMQLFGHGVKDILVVSEDTRECHQVLGVSEIDGKVYIIIRKG